MKKLFCRFALISSILISFAVTSFAQNEQLGTGSVYSFFGIGTLNDFKNPQAAGMGLSGVATLNVANASLANPALWGYTFYTVGAGGVSISNYETSVSGGQNVNSNLNATHLQLVFPINRSKLGLSFSIAPISETSYNFTQTDNIFLLGDQTALQADFEVERSGSGGLNAMELGVGYRINEELAIGWAPSLIFGDIKRREAYGFTAGNNQLPSAIVNDESNVGFGNRFGLLYRKADIFKKDDHVIFGTEVTLATRLSSDLKRRTEVQRGVVTSTISRDADGVDTELPFRLTSGLTYSPSTIWTFGSEFLYENWSNFESEFNRQSGGVTNDRIRLGIGAQVIPGGARGRRFFEILQYRAGFSYDTGYLRIQGQDIGGWSVHSGIGFPSKFSLSTFDISAQYGVLGTKSAGLAQEKIFSLRLSFNLSELMFAKRRIQ